MSFLFGKETEKEEYERLLKENKEAIAYHKKWKDDIKKRREEADNLYQRKKYLEEKFNPNKDKPSIIKPDQREILGKQFKEEKQREFEEIVKKYPNISFEEAILRSYSATRVYYKDEYFIKKFKQLSNTNLTNLSPPKPPVQPLVSKRSSPKPKSEITNQTLQQAKSKLKPKDPPPLPSSPVQRASSKRTSPKSSLTSENLQNAKSKLKPKGPPYPPPLPSTPVQRTSPKRSSPKSSLTSENLQNTKSKLKIPPPRIRKLDPQDPNYELELAFPPPLPSSPKKRTNLKASKRITDKTLQDAKSKLRQTKKSSSSSKSKSKSQNSDSELEKAFKALEQK